MPAKAGIQNYLKTLDSRLRVNDAKGRFKLFYETIKIKGPDMATYFESGVGKAIFAFTFCPNLAIVKFHKAFCKCQPKPGAPEYTA